ncbi:DUF4129 domain-containing protein [Paenibacillus filicis]|uniref:DUF4129 domain-containing protein n=1 Tax=Paenibacillus filicis TaxID=669464 RepID=A0ABU9DTT1_9BACL
MTNSELQADKDKLSEILSRDEFAGYLRERPSPLLGWLERMWEKLFGLFPDVGLPPGTSKLLAYTVLGIVLVLLGAAILWLIRSAILLRRSRMRSVFGSAADLDRSSAVYREEAERLAAAGDYAEAVRRMFLGLLLQLDEQGWVRAEKWKTNREYIEELLDSKPGLAASFADVAALFEHVVYGGGEVSSSDYVRLRDMAEAAQEGGGRYAEAQ